MAISQHHQEQSPSSLLDALYCEEEQWEVEEDEEEDDVEERENNNRSLFPILLLEQDLFWEDEELLSLFSKEEKQRSSKQGSFEFDPCFSSVRRDAVDWMLMVNAHYGFCTLTAILAVDYFDRFLSTFNFQKDKPWTMQLLAVTCLSLAAKVEETCVPLLLDLQVEGTKYMFEAKNIQKMELLVLSTLEWKMNPVNPLSFLDHVIRRLGLKNHLHWEFFRRCERLLLSVLPDCRFVGYVPSVLATATMMHVIDHIEACNPLDYQNQLLGVLNISKEKVMDCYELIVELARGTRNKRNESSKRKFDDEQRMNAITSNMNIIIPNRVIDVYYLSCETSNDSWEAATTTTTSSSNHDNYNNAIGLSSSSVSSSPVNVLMRSRKKGRLHEQVMTSLQLPSLARFFVDVVSSPR